MTPCIGNIYKYRRFFLSKLQDNLGKDPLIMDSIILKLINNWVQYRTIWGMHYHLTFLDRHVKNLLCKGKSLTSKSSRECNYL